MQTFGKLIDSSQSTGRLRLANVYVYPFLLEPVISEITQFASKDSYMA